MRVFTFPNYGQGQTSPSVGSLQVPLDRQGLPILPKQWSNHDP